MAHVEVEEMYVWYLNSGCSNHMCGTTEWFIKFDDKFRQQVKLGDNRRMHVEGRGNIRLNQRHNSGDLNSIFCA